MSDQEIIDILNSFDSDLIPATHDLTPFQMVSICHEKTKSIGPSMWKDAMREWKDDPNESMRLAIKVVSWHFDNCLDGVALPPLMCGHVVSIFKCYLALLEKENEVILAELQRAFRFFVSKHKIKIEVGQ